MSKIGEKPLSVPIGVTVSVTGQNVEVKGKEGNMTFGLPKELSLEKEQKANCFLLKRKNDAKHVKALHGLFRSLLANAIIGVEKPWEKILEVVGTGYNVKLQGQNLVFKVGYSHPVEFKKVEGIQFEVEGNTKVTVRGINKQLVGEVAYKIKKIRIPDVYKGKGIKFENEKLRIKPGKKAKAA